MSLPAVRGRRLGLALVLAAVLAVTVVPRSPNAATLRHGGGIVPQAQFRVSHGVYFTFTFKGRMPAGAQWVTVQSGQGSFSSQYGAPYQTYLTGTTLGGATYYWECLGYWLLVNGGTGGPVEVPGVGSIEVGATYLYDARCTTPGLDGGFALKLLLYQTGGPNSPYAYTRTFKGVYHAVLNDF